VATPQWARPPLSQWPTEGPEAVGFVKEAALLCQRRDAIRSLVEDDE